eukprot:3886769-Rhodomonas_salina.2
MSYVRVRLAHAAHTRRRSSCLGDLKLQTERIWRRGVTIDSSQDIQRCVAHSHGERAGTIENRILWSRGSPLQRLAEISPCARGNVVLVQVDNLFPCQCQGHPSTSTAIAVRPGERDLAQQLAGHAAGGGNAAEAPLKSFPPKT